PLTGSDSWNQATLISGGMTGKREGVARPERFGRSFGGPEMRGRMDGRDHGPEEKNAGVAQRGRAPIRGRGPDPESLGVAMMAGEDAPPSEEANALRRVRLRAAILLLAAGLVLVQARDAVIGGGAPWQLQIGAILALAFVLSLLSFPGPLSARRL